MSPLTREPLEANVFPNRALKKRIDEHEEEVLRMAATVFATGIAAAAADPSGGSSSGAVPGASEGGSEPRSQRGTAKRGAAPPLPASEAAQPKRSRRE